MRTLKVKYNQILFNFFSSVALLLRVYLSSDILRMEHHYQVI